MKTLLALRHLAFEDLGLLAPLMQARGWHIAYHDMGVDDLSKLDLSQVGMLVMLGGPIGAEDDARYPFLVDEVRLVRERLSMRQPMLGICLGAQLIARAMGARVLSMGHKEIGYGPMALTSAGKRSPLAALGDQPVLHWHGDQFEMPHGVNSLATTELCPNQAFVHEQRVMAWQFHLEVDAVRIESWLVGHAGELAQEQILTQCLRDDAKRHGDTMKQTLSGVMDAWLGAWPP
jgi:GMP synthase (glutamine-hydrolysing)